MYMSVFTIGPLFGDWILDTSDCVHVRSQCLDRQLMLVFLEQAGPRLSCWSSVGNPRDCLKGNHWGWFIVPSFPAENQQVLELLVLRRSLQNQWPLAKNQEAAVFGLAHNPHNQLRTPPSRFGRFIRDAKRKNTMWGHPCKKTHPYGQHPFEPVLLLFLWIQQISASVFPPRFGCRNEYSSTSTSDFECDKSKYTALAPKCLE